MSDSCPVLDAASMRQALADVAQQIAAKNANGTEVVLVGIQRGGVFLAQRLRDILEKNWGWHVLVGKLDVAMHRDDLDCRAAPQVHPTSIPFDINKKTVILVDDVLFKGRTVRAAMDALNDLGRPQRIQLAVLVDRGHRELPIHADFVGKIIQTGIKDRVDVRLQEDCGEEVVILETA
jgi:pyrimidine operon attenuation protein / uracil phosphoribosyltransferase